MERSIEKNIVLQIGKKNIDHSLLHCSDIIYCFSKQYTSQGTLSGSWKHEIFLLKNKILNLLT